MTTLYQPKWVTDKSILQSSLSKILSLVVTNPDHMKKLIDQDSIDKYWIKCFTHKSVDSENNYEMMEFYGDSVLRYAFVMYLRKSTNGKLTEMNATLALSQYMSKPFQAQLAKKLGLDKLVRYDPTQPDINLDVQEDILESFFGTFNLIVEDKIYEGMGYSYCYNLIAILFQNIQININTIKQDPKTRLKNLYDKLDWGPVNYVDKLIDPKTGEYLVELRSPTGNLLGSSRGKKNRAKFRVAEQALETLKKLGMTEEKAETMKIERSRKKSPEFDEQYRRATKALQEYNKIATQENGLPASDFRLTEQTLNRVNGIMRYSVILELKFMEKGTPVWKAVLQENGNDKEELKIQLLKQFADICGVK